MVRLEPKTATEERNYTFSWLDFLGTSDFITNSTVTVTGLVLVGATHDTTTVSVEVNGGTDGTTARIYNTITTTNGLTETEIFVLPINSGEVVSLAEAKLHLEVDDDGHDSLIANSIVAARTIVEAQSGFVMTPRVCKDSFRTWEPFLELTRRPVSSITSIDYIDSNGALQTYTGFIATPGRNSLRIYPGLTGSWPTLGRGGEINITYMAGFAAGDSTDEIELARQAILLLVGHWYYQREAVSDKPMQEVPFAARALIDSFKTMVV